jgi:hypothetical protein
MSPPSQPEKTPVVNNLGIHHHLDVHVKEGNNLKVFKLVVANLA